MKQIVQGSIQIAIGLWLTVCVYPPTYKMAELRITAVYAHDLLLFLVVGTPLIVVGVMKVSKGSREYLT